MILSLNQKIGKGSRKRDIKKSPEQAVCDVADIAKENGTRLPSERESRSVDCKKIILRGGRGKVSLVFAEKERSIMTEELYLEWLERETDDELSEELRAMKDDEEKKEDCFYKNLEFGTGGLRGILGAGTNRMNIRTVGRATFGLAAYLAAKKKDASVAVAYDTRNKSHRFAFQIADILSSRGIKAYVFDAPMPTPVLSFAVRHLKADAGIVVTASHNPKEYNGYKVYNEKGCQITDFAAAEITDYIDGFGYFVAYEPNKSLVHTIGQTVLDAFLDEILKYRLTETLNGAYPSLVYTPLHGTGQVPMEKLFGRMGVSDYVVVPEQAEPDGNFTTCPYPNPEEKTALKLAVELAKERGAELVLATDPDADRVGVVVKNRDKYRYLTGNETGVLLENYILSKKKERGLLNENSVVVKTIVTTDMAKKIASDYGATTMDVLTGFKYIGETIDRLPDEKNYVFGLEESYGYLVGTHARDKDSVSAVMLIVEMAAHYKGRGLTLVEVLNGLYEKYGYCATSLQSYKFGGVSGKKQMDVIIGKVRKAPFESIAGESILEYTDYSLGVNGLPESNVLSFVSASCKIVVRPSGTEPKLKIYYFADGKEKTEAEEKMAVLIGDVKAKMGL